MAYLNFKNFARFDVGAAQQSLAADGAIACFSTNLFLWVVRSSQRVHIVLVDDAALELKANAGKGKSAAINTLKKREAYLRQWSIRREFEFSRGEEFDGGKLKNLIRSPGGALKVRVTGLLFYDSEHALGPFKLTRKTDWALTAAPLTNERSSPVIQNITALSIVEKISFALLLHLRATHYCCHSG